ncbi:MAG: helix-turn-helix transcriptional regulator [Synergistaceae bacterium]|nr:helix-turn-helix transcriptional regulator [Synergistaceae bacterium]
MIGETIRKYRKLRGLTQPQLCEALHIHQTHISKIEQGKRSPSVALLTEIRKLLDIPFEDIWGAEGAPEDIAACPRAAASPPEDSGQRLPWESAVVNIMASLDSERKKKIYDYALEQLELQRFSLMRKKADP